MCAAIADPGLRLRGAAELMPIWAMLDFAAESAAPNGVGS
jgi:hypothetical protein